MVCGLGLNHFAHCCDSENTLKSCLGRIIKKQLLHSLCFIELGYTKVLTSDGEPCRNPIGLGGRHRP